MKLVKKKYFYNFLCHVSSLSVIMVDVLINKESAHSFVDYDFIFWCNMWKMWIILLPKS
jgi:hypothetical protein